jgi:hypothetical protein
MATTSTDHQGSGSRDAALGDGDVKVGHEIVGRCVHLGDVGDLDHATWRQAADLCLPTRDLG